MEAFDWERMSMNGSPPLFLFEVLVRSVTIFIVTFAFLRVIGRSGVRQMSSLEVVILLVLGSAASDVALQGDFPFFPVVVTFVTITACYKLLTYSLRKSSVLQGFAEGGPVLMVKEGRLLSEQLDVVGVSRNELLMELRQKSIEHLGQVRLAWMEQDGNLSVFFYADEEVRPGLSILPSQTACDNEQESKPRSLAHYSCSGCGLTLRRYPEQLESCAACTSQQWALSSQARRIG